MLSSSVTPLRHCIKQVFIIAHREDTRQLETVLSQEGFTTRKVLRQVPKPEQCNYSRNYLAFLNHHCAWEEASQVSGITLVVEADFVPVQNMGLLPLPLDPMKTNMGIAWLYTCAPQLYSVSAEGYAQGFSTSMVAYLVNQKSAIALANIATQMQQSIDPLVYYPWDSQLAPLLRKQNFENFIPFRNYGEHGGRPNPEHIENGLSRTHRADVLYGPLAFSPMYAEPHSTSATHPRVGLARWKEYGWTRLQGRLIGLGRLALGKFLRFKVLRRSSVPIRLLSFAIRRQCLGAFWFSSLPLQLDESNGRECKL